MYKYRIIQRKPETGESVQIIASQNLQLISQEYAKLQEETIECNQNSAMRYPDTELMLVAVLEHSVFRSK